MAYRKTTCTINLTSLLVVALVGCAPVRQPWAGRMYEPPKAQDGPSRMTYTIPQMLPSRRSERVSTADEDLAIEQMLGITPQDTDKK